MTPTPKQLEEYIRAGLACEHLHIEGDGRHFFATIVSAAFNNLRPLQRHQKIYAILGERMHEEIHALSMKTLTPEEWQQAK